MTWKINVVPSDSEWAVLFEQEQQLLLQQFSPVVKCVHHIGSTSIDGLAAKPIIDILLEVSSLEEVDTLTSEFEQFGYQAMGEYGIERRRYFRKGPVKRTHHIHAFLVDDPHVRRHLAFRDYLKAHPEIATEYAALKFAVATKCNNDIDAYCAGKNDFITLHEKNALQWIEKKGKSRVFCFLTES